MFLDWSLRLSNRQPITADALSVFTVDLGNPLVRNRVGTGELLVVQVQVDVAADFTTGDESYAIELLSSAAGTLSSPTVLARYPLSAAQLSPGKAFALPIPSGMPAQRYLGLHYDVGGTSPSVTLTANVAPASMAEAELVLYSKHDNA